MISRLKKDCMEEWANTERMKTREKEIESAQEQELC